MEIFIAYHSDYGNTRKIAEAVAAGAKAVAADANIVIKQAAETSLDDLLAADAIFFGTPVHMGSMAWQMKKLIDEAAKLWMENALEGKVGGVFASGGGFGGGGGGAELALMTLYSNFLEHGMTVIGFPKSLTGYADAGLQWGLYARCGNHEGMPEAIKDSALVAARSYGAHVTEIATRLIEGL